MTTIHFIDVGAGNMVLIQTESGENLLYDCNLTDENADRVLSYLENQMGEEGKIDVFICSHRDADHIRGIELVRTDFDIDVVWDSGSSVGSPHSSEYKTYMKVRKEVGFEKLRTGCCFDFGKTKLDVLFAGDPNLPNDPNTQSIVLKITHKDSNKSEIGSVLLTGDTDYRTWKDCIMKKSKNRRIFRSDILLASHHGSYSFFGTTEDESHPYTKHLEAIFPSVTVISTDGESHNHPNVTAESLYEEKSYGAESGEKVVRTGLNGTMKLIIGYSNAPIDTAFEPRENEGFIEQALLPRNFASGSPVNHSTDWRLYIEKSG